MKKNIVMSIDFESTIVKGKIRTYLYQISATLFETDQVISTYYKKFIHEDCLIQSESEVQRGAWIELREWLPKEKYYVFMWDESLRIIIDKLNKTYNYIGPMRYISIQKALTTFFDYSYNQEIDLQTICQLLNVEFDESQKNIFGYKAEIYTKIYLQLYKLTTNNYG